MKCVSITGGPYPKDIRVVDVETGLDLTDRVRALEVLCDATGPATVRLTFNAVLVDLKAEVASIEKEQWMPL